MKYISLFILIIFIGVSSISSAQEASQPIIGLGAGIIPFSNTTYFIHVPITFQHMRINPELGFSASSSNYSSSSSYSSSSTVSTSNGKSTNIRIGTGLYYLYPPDNSVDIYFGPRGGIVLSSSTRDSKDIYSDSTQGKETVTEHTKETSTDYFVGGAIGGEYYFSKHFSIGAEIQLTYLHEGEPTIEHSRTADPPNADYNTSYNSTSQYSSFGIATLLLVRWFF
jgi:hypothetical protein